MFLAINGGAWKAEIKHSVQPDGAHNMYVVVSGQTANDAFEGADDILRMFCQNRWSFIRTKPEVVSETRFDTKETIHRGLVRFTFYERQGEWHYPEPGYETIVPTIGAA